MPKVTAHLPGTFCWPELYTSDQNGSKKFLTQLFDWGIRDIPMGPEAVYTVFTLHGADVAACYGEIPDMYEENLPSHWMSYVYVANADDAASKAKNAGGSILKPPFDVPNVGRMAVIRDPVGAVFCVWQDKGKPGIGLSREPGTLQWTELLASDTEKAAAFYEETFGWKRTYWPSPDNPAYHMFMLGDVPAGGMTPITPEMNVKRSSWGIYFNVADCDAAVALAKKLGGRVTMPPESVPDVGRFAILADPAGAHFGVMTPAR